jgi:hypothetical protein
MTQEKINMSVADNIEALAALAAECDSNLMNEISAVAHYAVKSHCDKDKFVTMITLAAEESFCMAIED